MIKDGGQRIATFDGAMLADPASLGNLPGIATPTLATPTLAVVDMAATDIFEPAFWAARGELVDVTHGRGSAWFIESAAHHWALRHYRRGGFIARLSRDRYVWAGEERVRAFAEWRLLAALTELGLPVPKPIAAHYRRTGIFYRCDLITQRIAGAQPLSSMLGAAPLREGAWREVGLTVARFHAAGVDHADLNAHNILLDGHGAVSVIDFDRGRLRRPGAWTSRNLSRLRRSLAKISRGLPPDRFSDAAWRIFLAGYASTLVHAPS
jgi:3-deoxy-D-manno-octulosonic acid kinase